MTTTDAKAFVDTNVLLRSIHTTMPLHEPALALIKQYREDGYELWISRQIVREYLVQVTRQGILAQPLTAAEAREKVDLFRSAFRIADDTDTVTTHLLALLNEFPTGGKQVHDANIVATMLAYSVSTLLTQNIADMQRYSSRIQIIPLAETSA